MGTMSKRLVFLATLALLVTMAGCAVRFSAEVKNPWHPDTPKPANTQVR
jgi:hypothetical protein